MEDVFRTSKLLICLAVTFALVLGFHAYPYELEEALVCWLFFALGFAGLLLLVCTAVAVYWLGERIVHRASTVASGYREWRSELQKLI